MAPAPEGGSHFARLAPGVAVAAGPRSARGRADGEETKRRRRRFKYDNEAKFPETAAATHRLHVRLPLPPSAAFSNNSRQSAAPGAVTCTVPMATADAASPARGGARREGRGRAEEAVGAGKGGGSPEAPECAGEREMSCSPWQCPCFNTLGNFSRAACHVVVGIPALCWQAEYVNFDHLLLSAEGFCLGVPQSTIT